MINKTKIHAPIVAALFLIFCFACKKKDEVTLTPDNSSTSNLKIITVPDFAADPVNYDPKTGKPTKGTGKYHFFKFTINGIQDITNNAADSATAKWDLGLRGYYMLINGGKNFGAKEQPGELDLAGNAEAQVISGIFDDIKEAPASGYRKNTKDALAISSEINGSSLLTYNRTTHIVTPTPGKILIIKTTDGKYVKMEILSYYKGAPANPTLKDLPGYYTFKYAIQGNCSRTF